jgi:hypothetical protein
MDANDFFVLVEEANPEATWNVTTTEVGAQIIWEWDVTLDGFKNHDYIIPAEAMKDDELIKRHLQICQDKMLDIK